MTREFLPAGTAGTLEATSASSPSTIEADAIVVFLTVELTIAKFLFFPPVVRQGLDQRVINDVKRILGLP